MANVWHEFYVRFCVLQKGEKTAYVLTNVGRGAQKHNPVKTENCLSHNLREKNSNKTKKNNMKR